MSFALEQPLWLIALVPAAAMALAALRAFLSMTRIRRASAAVFRFVLVALLVGALAGASTIQRSQQLAVVAVIDQSASVQRFASVETRDQLRALVDAIAAARGPDDLLGVVAFDGRALAVAAPSRAELARDWWDFQPTEGTAIADAIQLAARLIPPDASGRILLISDGNETRGHALHAAEGLARTRGRGTIPVDVIEIPYAVTDETVVEFVDAPPRAAAEAPVTVRVGLRSSRGASGTLYLLREGEPIDLDPQSPATGRRLRLPPGRHVELISVPLPPGRLHRFEAVFEPDRLEDGSLLGDRVIENNRGEVFTITPGRGSVLLVNGPSNPGLEESALAHALRRGGLDVTVTAPEGVPATLLSFQAFDLVILDNVPAEDLPRTTHDHLAAFVRELGGGLVMVGGHDAFGAGGWKGSAIEPILPVLLDLPERLVMAQAAIILVLDSSGSMGANVLGSSRTQQQIANESAALAIRSLDAHDLIGVIEFNSSARVVVPLAENADPEAAAARVRAIAPGGGTRMAPALIEAHRQLRNVQARTKHVIVLSDGRSQGADVLPDIVQRMRADGIRVSAIAIGDAAEDDTMSALAVAGEGVYYRVLNATVLPRVFLKAVRVIRSPMVLETPFQPRVLPTGSPLLVGIHQPPTLFGLTLTQARPEPTITYEMLGPDDAPLLAHWPVELGHVAAFTSDSHQWARLWLTWPGFQRLWTQLARLLSRADALPGLQLTTQIDPEGLAIRLDAADARGQPIDLLHIEGRAYQPDGSPVDFRLHQTAPGLYETTVPVGDSGTYVVVLKPSRGRESLPPIVGAATLPAADEFLRLSSDPALLHQLAERTGGRVLPLDHATAQLVFDRRGVVPAASRSSIWRHLLLWALVVLMLDVGTRRVAWDRFVSREFGADITAAAAAAVRDRSAQAARTLAGLRGSARVQRSVDPTIALSDDDAQRIARAAQQARQTRRLEQLSLPSRRATGPTAAPPPDTAAPPDTAETPPGQDDRRGLLAAKRRARQRFDPDATDDPTLQPPA